MACEQTDESANMCPARAEGTYDGQRCPLCGNPSAITFSGESPRYKSIDELLVELGGRGFTDVAEEGSHHVLAHVGYQHLAPYLSAVEGFPEDFDRTVKMAHDLLTFDRRFQSVILRYIGILEGHLRAAYTDSMCSRHGAFALYDGSLFLRPDDYADTAASYKEELSKRCAQDKRVRSECERWGGVVPMWVGAECMTLGSLCRFYRNTADRDVTDEVAESFGATKAELANWTRTITQVRNICAHFNPYVVRREIPSTPKAIKGSSNPCPRRAPLFVVVLLAHLLRTPVQYRDANMNYESRIAEDASTLLHEFEGYCGGLIPLSGFPPNWRSILGVERREEFAKWNPLIVRVP